jgi:hypothetical protein
MIIILLFMIFSKHDRKTKANITVETFLALIPSSVRFGKFPGRWEILVIPGKCNFLFLLPGQIEFNIQYKFIIYRKKKGLGSYLKL